MSAIQRILIAATLIATARGGTLDTVKANEVLIYRDRWGVPHIYGKSAAAVAFGFGYAQAEDHLEAMLKLFLSAKGEISKVEGEGAVERDLTQRTLLVPEIVDRTWSRVPQSSQDYYRAFADGINRYIETHAGERQPWYWKITARDVAIYTKQMILRDGLWTAGEKMTAAHAGDGNGSNAWAIAGWRSASGKAMLLGNPHLPWTGPLQWYEAHLKCPEFDMEGVGFFGSPVLALGHTADIAWSNTDNKADIVNVYREKVEPRNPDRYLDSDGQWKTMETRTFQIEARPAGGGMKTVARTARYTRRGPYMPGADGQSYSVAIAGWKDMPDALTGAIRRAEARNLDEFKAALAEYPLDKWHVVYADRYGNIFVAGNGYFPRRDPKYKWDQPVPGWEEAAQWKGVTPFREVPQFANPPGGVIVQCNQSIFASAEPSPLNPADYPSWIARGAMVNQRDSRAHRAFELLGGAKVTWEDHKRTALDPYGPAADHYVQLLLAALEEPEAARDADLEGMHSILQNWDRMATLDNRAMAILSHWIRLAAEKHLNLNQVGSNTPQARAAALSLLRETAAEMHRLYGKVSVPMRDVQVLERGGKEWPVAGTGGPGSFNPFAGLFSTQTKAYRNGKFYATNGSSWMMLIAFETPLKVYTLVPYGNSENPASPHFADQSELYSRQELKPAPFTDEDVKKLAERHYTLAIAERSEDSR